MRGAVRSLRGSEQNLWRAIERKRLPVCSLSGPNERNLGSYERNPGAYARLSGVNERKPGAIARIRGAALRPPGRRGGQKPRSVLKPRSPGGVGGRWRGERGWGVRACVPRASERRPEPRPAIIAGLRTAPPEGDLKPDSSGAVLSPGLQAIGSHTSLLPARRAAGISPVA
jgi:hypothetical protein